MRARTLTRVLFILYCIEAGVLLVIAPWSPAWDTSIFRLSGARVQDVLLSPVTRGAISGFGLVHLVWAAHDLELWLSRGRAAPEEE